MPKMDPRGVEVMTAFEFLAEEERREGKAPGSILAEIGRELEADDRRIEAEWRKPEEALEILQKVSLQDRDAWHGWKAGGWMKEPEPMPPFPLRVVEVVDAAMRQGFRESGGRIVARCRCEDGLVRTAAWTMETYSGDFYEPPSEDEGIEWSEPETKGGE